jgi:predicted transglutaminase-like protease
MPINDHTLYVLVPTSAFHEKKSLCREGQNKGITAGVISVASTTSSQYQKQKKRCTRPLLTVLNNHTFISSNQELVQQCIALARTKKEACERSLQHVQERNLHFKRMLYTIRDMYFYMPSRCQYVKSWETRYVWIDVYNKEEYYWTR